MLIGDHRSVENKLHWSLDVSFGEDASRLRQGHAAENLARLWRQALGLLKQERSLGLSLPRKRKRAAWRPDYLLTVLALADSMRWSCRRHTPPAITTTAIHTPRRRSPTSPASDVG